MSAEVQHLIREGAPIGLLMAGLPKAVEELLNDDITTFLRRAERIELGEVAIDDVCEALKSTFDTGAKALSNDLAQECANATGGYPFMIQLVGYQVWKHSGDGPVTQPAVAAGTTAARLRLGNLVHAPALRDLSDVDRTMLVCIAKDDGPSQIADIAERMDRPVNYVSVYRNRLLTAGIIKTAGYGKVDFAAPYLREYLREHAAHLVME